MTDASDVAVVVPAHEEAGRIGPAVAALVEEYDVLVVDDGSTDGTAAEARAAGARVVEQPENRGYAAALARGFGEATGDVVVTYDGDGENRPADVARLVEPVADGRHDLVLGARAVVPRRSERALNAVVRRRTGVSDAYTGFRALRRELAASLDLDATDNCGTLVLRAVDRGASVGEVPVRRREVKKPRGVRWEHCRHLVRILRSSR